MLTRKTVALASLVAVGVMLPLATLRPVARAQGVAETSPQSRPSHWMSQAMAHVSADQAASGEVDAGRLLYQGCTLSPEGAASLERNLTSHPDDLATRLQLLGYYSMAQFSSEKGRIGNEEQISWFIRNQSAIVTPVMGYIHVFRRKDPDRFHRIGGLWLSQVAKHPSNAVVLGNAAEYFTLADEPIAARLLQRARAVDPKNPEWPNKLGELYRLQTLGVGHATSPDIRRQWAKKSLVQFEAAATLAGGIPEANNGSMVQTAFDAGEYAKARQYATELLQRSANGKDMNADSDAHYGNLILGRLALRDGDVTQAEAHLLAMGRIAGSPSLDTFGPNMQLAQDLLLRGDRAPVLAYFDECAKFWTMGGMGKSNLAKWRTQVGQRKTPDFGANLIY